MILQSVDTIFAFAVVMLLLSLVITILNQIIVAISGMRGKSLIWGVTKLLERSPKLKGHAAEITEKVLEHPVLNPTGKTAKVIGSKELMALLKNLAEPSDTSLSDQAKAALKEALEEAVPPESQEHAEELASEFKKLFPGEAAKMDETMKLVQAKSKKLLSDFDTWFDTIMNRCTDRFVTHTRYLTIVFAVLLAIGLQIDSLDLLKKLSTNAELRATHIKTSDKTLEHAEQVFLEKSIAVQTLEAIRKDIEELKLKEIPSNIVTRKQGLEWLDEELKESAEIANIKKAYNTKFEELTPKQIVKLVSQTRELQNQLEESRLVILPVKWKAYKEYWCNFGSRLPGIILSIILLSLGAPFWFNALRSLAALRPLLAGSSDPSKSVKK